MATLADQSVHSGNSILVKVGGVSIGRAQSLSSERSFGTTGVYEIGSIMPQEHIFLKYEGTVTLDRFRMRKDNKFDVAGKALGENVLRMGVIDIVLEDATTKNVIESYLGCSIDTISMENRANEISSENCRFYYLTASKSGK